MAEEIRSNVPLKGLAIRLFGPLADEYGEKLGNLKESLKKSNMGMLYRTYVSLMFLYSAIGFLISFLIALLFVPIFPFDIFKIFIGLLIAPLIIFIIVFAAMYSYPVMIAGKRKTDIEINLPFAVTHMSAISSSGVSPYILFKILSKFKEYGEISKEAERIVKNVDVFGLDEISAINDSISRTPSPEFKEILEGIMSTIKTGGDLEKYLNTQAEKMLFNYRLGREKYINTLSTYADIYTALLITSPLLFIAILSILNLLGGQLYGFPIQTIINVGIFVVIPLLNILFLAFLEFTQPKM